MDNLFFDSNLKQKNDSQQEKDKGDNKMKITFESGEQKIIDKDGCESTSPDTISISDIDSETTDNTEESNDSFVVSDSEISYMTTSDENMLSETDNSDSCLDSDDEINEKKLDSILKKKIVKSINSLFKKTEKRKHEEDQLMFLIEDLDNIENEEDMELELNLETRSENGIISRIKRTKMDTDEIEKNEEYEKIKKLIKEKNQEIDEFRSKSNPYNLNIEEKILLSDFDLSTKHELLLKWKNTPKSGEESYKLKQWFNALFNIPIRKYKPLPISKDSSSEEIEAFLTQSKEKLDNVVYGMDSVKEEILSFIIKKINNTESKGTILALHGPKGTAKCLAPGTKILLHSGRSIKVEDVNIGDVLLGDRSQKQNVLSTATGFDYMYQIIPKYGLNHTVNKEHILCLKNIITRKIIEIPVKDFIRKPFLVRKLYRCYKNPLEFPEQKLEIDPYIIGFNHRRHLSAKIDHKILYNSRKVRLNFLAGLLDIKPEEFETYSDCEKFTIRNFDDQKNLYFLIHSLGMTVIKINAKKIVFVKENRTDPIKIKPLGLGRYYGFELDGNSRFVLEDCTISHNTRIARKGIAEVLGLPFHSINFGGMKDSSVLLGHDFTYSGSTYGKIAQILMKSGYMNNVIYLDELDKVSAENANEIFGVLTHLLDEEQNHEFEDNYFKGIKLDLKNTFFIISFNDLQHINHITADRMRIINIKAPNEKEKINIVRDIVIPEITVQNMNNSLEIIWSEESIKYLVSKFTQEGMMRNIRETIKQIIEKINLSFYSKGKFVPQIYKYLELKNDTPQSKYIIKINKEIIDNFIKNEQNISFPMMYL